MNLPKEFFNSSASQFYPTLCLRNLQCYKKNPKKIIQKPLLKNTLYTCKQPLLMAYERSKSVQDNCGKFIHQFQSETKTLIRKLERILIKSHGQNVSLLFNQTCLNVYVHIYCHSQTDCFVVSQLFSVARLVGGLKPGSKLPLR